MMQSQCTCSRLLTATVLTHCTVSEKRDWSGRREGTTDSVRREGGSGSVRVESGLS